MYSGALVEKHGDVGRGYLAAERHDGGKAHHYGLHLVFVNEHDLLGKLGVVSDAAVALEELVEQLCDVLNDDVLLGVADAQMLAAQTLSVAVDHHGNGEVVCHPAVAEHRLDVAGLYKDDPRHVKPVVEPSGVIVKCVNDTAPLTAASVTLTLDIYLAEVLAAYSLVAHFFSPPWILLISTLSTNA